MKPTQLEAFKKILPKIDSLKYEVLEFFKKNPASSRRDVSDHFEDYTTYVPRVTELEFLGLIKPVGKENGRELLSIVLDQRETLKIHEANKYKKALENSPEARFIKSYLECVKRDSLPTQVTMTIEANRDFITPKP